MKKKNKDIPYIPHQDTWTETFPNPGKINGSGLGFRFADPDSQYNKLLRTQNKLKSKRK